MAAGTDIFISYKREEEDLARAYAAAFDKLNYLVVTDLNVPEGTEFGDAIDTMIGEASLVVVLWTPGAADSRWVRSEAIEADRQGKYLGVAAKPINENDIPLEVRHSQYLDVSGMTQAEAIRTVTDSAKARVEEHRRAAQASQTQQQRIAEDMEFFARVHGVGEPSGYQAYLDLYPRGVFQKEATAQVTGWSAWVRRSLGTPSALIQTTFAVLGVIIAAYAAFGPAPFSDDGKVRITQIQREKSDLQRRLDAMQTTNAGLLKEKHEREAELAEARKQLSDASQTDSAELQAVRQDQDDLTRQLAIKQNELTQAHASNSDAKAEVQRLQAALFSERQRLRNAEAQLTTKLSIRGDMEERLFEAKDQARRLQGELDALRAAITPPAKPVVPTEVDSGDETTTNEASELMVAAANSKVQLQLAGDPSEATIREMWSRIQRQHYDILKGRALAVQTTVSGGITFYRLRVGPFRDASEARAVCQALKARGQDCLVARNS